MPRLNTAHVEHDSRSSPAGYDEEARYFEAGVRKAKKQDLVVALHNTAKPSFQQQLAHLHAGVLETFKTSLDKAVKEDPNAFSVAAKR